MRDEEKATRHDAVQLDMQAAMGAYDLIKTPPPTCIECAADSSASISSNLPGTRVGSLTDRELYP